MAMKRNYLLMHEKTWIRNSLVVQWLGLHALTAEGPGSIPGRGTKIPQAVQHGKKPPKKQNKNLDKSQKYTER